MKALFKETPHTELWVHQLNVPEYRSIAKKAFSVLIQMPTTYLCERNLRKKFNHKRRSIDEEAIENDILPGFGMLVDDVQKQKIHQE